ncbi:Holliday junction DNA helicase RuvB [candidate division WWE3 bacterium RIFCSPHIGHO2_01_FULL_40_23]|uniref:Holliday junction branch migration complex subunit RuvB n=1 Tax=candidate division WWE3 bacterium RIFCSPLOWO2_01_FULL_41_18 TaxID=1802625 RepID=A0A1F4VEJ8_UNCKA|nr:MAG: Holliday junction DNA helicase RuvB [candidate division WWE3 bacterium RIFCSPHIGHO2_01_FULL_40_23]OGC55360.1 MAG: Holliday junction DNA helicase RuvB [candidate division WWE3 bacterium RIFCSPLOWO2_01_FULL_41_18]
MKKSETTENLEDKELDTTLRPKKLEEFIGQREVVSNLSVFIKAAKKRGEPIDHILFYGPPGIGKTTLALIIGNEFNASVKITSGPAIERTGDLASILTNLEDGDILFIDEIHRLNKTIEEIIYPAMEDFALDIILGKGPSARTVRIDLPKFTLIGATTKVGSLSNPLRDRFGTILKLNFYNQDDLKKIVSRSAEILGLSIDGITSEIVAKRARGTPRIANRLLKRVRDYSEVQNKEITEPFILKTMEKLGINDMGLDLEDVKYLKLIADKFNGGPVGLTTLSAALSEDTETIEDYIEPYLLQQGLITKTTKGRYVNLERLPHALI